MNTIIPDEIDPLYRLCRLVSEIRGLAFDRTDLPEYEALGRIRDAFRDHDERFTWPRGDIQTYDSHEDEKP